MRNLKQSNVINNDKLNQTKLELSEKHKGGFLFTNLVKQSTTFQYLCNITKEQLYLHLMPYPDCTGTFNIRKIDHTTELISVLTTC